MTLASDFRFLIPGSKKPRAVSPRFSGEKPGIASQRGCILAQSILASRSYAGWAYWAFVAGQRASASLVRLVVQSACFVNPGRMPCSRFRCGVRGVARFRSATCYEIPYWTQIGRERNICMIWLLCGIRVRSRSRMHAASISFLDGTRQQRRLLPKSL